MTTKKLLTMLTLLGLGVWSGAGSAAGMVFSDYQACIPPQIVSEGDLSQALKSTNRASTTPRAPTVISDRAGAVKFFWNRDGSIHEIQSLKYNADGQITGRSVKFGYDNDKHCYVSHVDRLIRENVTSKLGRVVLYDYRLCSKFKEFEMQNNLTIVFPCDHLKETICTGNHASFLKGLMEKYADGARLDLVSGTTEDIVATASVMYEACRTYDYWHVDEPAESTNSAEAESSLR